MFKTRIKTRFSWFPAILIASGFCLLPCCPLPGLAEETDTGVIANAAAVAKENESSTESVRSCTRTAEYVRLDTDRGPTIRGLLTSIHQMSGTIDGHEVTVDLIGAIHYGEKEYYQELNRRFKDYDAVLFELVMPKGISSFAEAEATQEAAEGRTKSPLAVIAYLQDWFGTTLNLASQIEEVDYNAANFVHADIDAETFMAEILRKGEAVDFMYKTAVESFGADGSSEDSTLAAALLFSRNRGKTLRRLFAKELVRSFDAESLSEEESTLISARNQIALTRLQEQVQAGNFHLAVFYGAAHLPDFQKRLEEEYKFKLTNTLWLRAWEM